MLILALTVPNGLRAADIAPISNAIKAGNADLLKNILDTEIDLVIPNSDGDGEVASHKCNANEAINILKNFFRAHKVSTFTVVHHADKNESGFLVGKLTAGGSQYRVNITYTLQNNRLHIQTIRIE